MPAPRLLRSAQTEPALRKLLLLACVLLFCACNSLFRQAMSRGDQAAEAGHWDEAAAAYAEAVAADPADEDAQLMLKHAKRQQALIRVARGNQLLQDGHAKEALTPFSEAVRLDPYGLEAKDGLERAKTKVLALAEAALGEDRDKEAFDLARAYLLVDPSHERAQAIERTARQKVAATATARGKAQEAKGAIALALVDYGEALQYLPSQEEAGARSAVVRKALREQVTFLVALKNFDGEQNADDLGSDVDSAVLANGMDPGLLLRIVDKLPKPPAYHLQGMRLGGLFRGYQFSHTSTSTARTCDYVCGSELVENPAYAGAKASMRTAQSALPSAEARRDAAKSAVGPARHRRDAATSQQAARQLEADRAEQDLSNCRAMGAGPPNQGNACAAQQQRREKAQAELGLANDELARESQAAANAERELADAESDLASKQTDAASKRAALEATPAKISVDKHCLHNYRVDTHFVNADVEVKLKGEGLYDTEVVLNRSVASRVAKQDDTFPAQAGVCAEVSQADALNIPSEAEAKKLLLSSAIAATQKELLAAFDRYRGGYLTRGNTLAADNKTDEASDQLMRYLSVTGPGGDKPAETATVAEIARLRAVDTSAVRLGVWGTE